MMSSSPDRTSVGAAISARRSTVRARGRRRLALKGLNGLLVGEGQRLLDDLTHRAVRVRGV